MPIHSLSEDILLKIFSVCSEVDWEGGFPAANSEKWDWILITHVSKYWRNLALSSPFLWSRPTLARHSQERLKAFLERSQDTPLTINTFHRFCPSYRPEMGCCLKCVENTIVALQHMNCIRKLSLIYVDANIFSVLLEKPAPLLEMLHLRSNSRFIGVIPASVANTLFNSYSPLLKKLVLQDFYIKYDARIFKGLEHLTIRDDKQVTYRSIEAFFPSVRELLAILEASPSLKELNLLTIRGSAELNSDRELPGLHQVEMQNLKSIELRALQINVCQMLLQYAKLPSFTSVSIGLLYINTDQKPTILSILRSISDRRRCDFLALELMGTHTCGFSHMTLKDVDEARDGPASIILKRLDGDGRPLAEEEVSYEEIAGTMAYLIRGSYWKDVTEMNLKLSIQYVLNDENWRMLLDSFGSLEKLMVRQVDTVNPMKHAISATVLEQSVLLLSTILSALTLQSEHNTMDGYSQESPNALILPRLKRLHFIIYSVAGISSQLLACMKTRKERGFAVHELNIINFDLFASGLSDISKFNLNSESRWHTEMRQYVNVVFCLSNFD